MSQHNSSPLTPGERAACIAVAGGCLAVSIMQAGHHMWQMAATPIQQVWLIGTVVFLLTGSQVIARLTGRNIAQRNFLISSLCLVCICFLEMFSIATSMASLDGRVASARRSQNLASPEYTMAMQNVSNYQQQIESLRSSSKKLPANYATKRQQLNDRITMLQTRMERAQRSANEIDVSVTGQTMDRIQERTGVSSTDMALTAAIMQSTTPLMINLAVGALVMRRKVTTGVVPGKKQQRHLRAA